MRVNSETSLRVAANTFDRFNRNWTEVHRRGQVNADGVLVIRGSGGATAEPKPDAPRPNAGGKAKPKAHAGTGAQAKGVPQAKPKRAAPPKRKG